MAPAENLWGYELLMDIEFDEGHLRHDVTVAEAEVVANMAILTDTHPTLCKEDNKLRWIFQLCWFRLKEVGQLALAFIASGHMLNN